MQKGVAPFCNFWPFKMIRTYHMCRKIVWKEHEIFDSLEEGTFLGQLGLSLAWLLSQAPLALTMRTAAPSDLLWASHASTSWLKVVVYNQNVPKQYLQFRFYALLFYNSLNFRERGMGTINKWKWHLFTLQVCSWKTFLSTQVSHLLMRAGRAHCTVLSTIAVLK